MPLNWNDNDIYLLNIHIFAVVRSSVEHRKYSTFKVLVRFEHKKLFYILEMEQIPGVYLLAPNFG